MLCIHIRCLYICEVSIFPAIEESLVIQRDVDLIEL